MVKRPEIEELCGEVYIRLDEAQIMVDDVEVDPDDPESGVDRTLKVYMVTITAAPESTHATGMICFPVTGDQRQAILIQRAFARIRDKISEAQGLMFTPDNS